MQTETQNGAGLYVHIPFCLQKCAYCSFVSRPVDANFTDAVRSYMDALIGEMRLRQHAWATTAFDSVFIGGGTPSILPEQAVGEILAALRAHFAICDGAEITCEANPESFTPEKAFLWRDAGVNRLSFGVQAAQDDLLRLLGRPHTFEGALCALDYARAVGFDSINADLICGLPGQTALQWEQSVRALLDAGLSHLSCYMLQLEEGTPLHARVQAGELPPIDDEATADMWERTPSLTAPYGFARYEVSNYALRGAQCRHNLHYWHNDAYLGLGVAAHSAWRGETGGWYRSANTEDVQAYIGAVAAGERPVQQRERIPRTEEMFECVMLATRTMAGLSLQAFYARFGVAFTRAFPSAVQRAVDSGLAVLTDRAFALNERGLLVQNAVLQWFL